MSEKPAPPYYAVIFTNVKTDVDEGYAQTAQYMEELAAQQPGYLGFESASDPDLTIAISYWQDLASIKAWKQTADHATAQEAGREKWYKSYTTRIALIEREYSFEKPEQ